jgi:hypothetical protein
MLTATVSGSFHRHLHAISLAVQELTDRGVKVLSPADPRVVDSVGDFLFVASDRVRSIRMVQDRHIESIRASSFLWLVTPDGYVGQSAAMEMGFATANQVPIFSTCLPFDLTLRQYVRLVTDLAVVCTLLQETTDRRAEGFLINPHDSIETVRRSLDRIERSLKVAEGVVRSRETSGEIYSACRVACRALTLP